VNHPIRILEDGPLISEGVLSHRGSPDTPGHVRWSRRGMSDCLGHAGVEGGGVSWSRYLPGHVITCPFVLLFAFSTTSSRIGNINYFLLYIVSLLRACMQEVMGTIVEEVRNQAQQ
jgi:hypothetical protein